MLGGQGRQIIKMFQYILNGLYKDNSYFPDYLCIHLDFLYKQLEDRLFPSFSVSYFLENALKDYITLKSLQSMGRGSLERQSLVNRLERKSCNKWHGEG